MSILGAYFFEAFCSRFKESISSHREPQQEERDSFKVSGRPFVDIQLKQQANKKAGAAKITQIPPTPPGYLFTSTQKMGVKNLETVEVSGFFRAISFLPHKMPCVTKKDILNGNCLTMRVCVV